MAIRSFKDKVSEEIFYGKISKRTQRRIPAELHQKTQIKMARLAAMTSLDDLAELRGSRLEKLKGNRAGQYSIRINNQYRICFRWENTDVYEVEVTDYH